jgi:hypothetical protein
MNGVEYTIYKREDLESASSFDESFVTFCISTLEFIARQKLGHAYQVPRISASLGTHGVYRCVQVVTQADGCSTERFLCWAEGGGLVTGTIFMHASNEAHLCNPSPQTYGNFPKMMKGIFSTCRVFFSMRLQCSFRHVRDASNRHHRAIGGLFHRQPSRSASYVNGGYSIRWMLLQRCRNKPILAVRVNMQRVDCLPDGTLLPQDMQIE